MRLEQWVKNVLICFPAFFGQGILNENIGIDLVWAIAGFSFIASAVYVINDLADIKSDREHPVKREKPIAKGELSKNGALTLMALLLGVGAIFLLQLGVQYLLYPAIYLVLNLAYSLFLKAIPIIDILCVSAGFLIRVLFGGQVSGDPISSWLALLIVLMAFFILITKRRNRKFNPATQSDFYARNRLEGIVIGASLLIFLSYAAYTVSPEVTEAFNSNYLWISIIPAILGLGRFTIRVLKTTEYMEPIRFILTDIIMIASLLLWSASLFLIIYG